MTGNLLSPQISIWDLSMSWHVFLLDVDKDGMSKPPQGLLILLDVRGSSARWFFPKLLLGIVPAHGEDSKAR